MRRAALERARTLRAWRLHLRLVHPGPDPPLCICESQPGRFRKTERIRGCGKARCWLCKRAKLMHTPRCRERLSNISYHEWLLELGRSAPSRQGGRALLRSLPHSAQSRAYW